MYLEKKIGSMKIILIYHLGLIVAGSAMLIVMPNSFNYGASPAIFACLGVLVNWFIRKRKLWSEYKSQRGFRFLLYYFLLSNFLGVSMAIIHLLGFCTGLLFGFIIKDGEL